MHSLEVHSPTTEGFRACQQAALMKKIFSELARRTAAGLASSRREQLNARGHVTTKTLSPYPIEYQKHLQTKDLATLQYVLSRQVEVFERQLELPSLTQIESERIANIMNYCPCERTKSLAKKIFEMTKAKEPTANQ
jgi:hypothetical protein